MGWEVSQTALYDTLVEVNRRCAPKSVYVTENGAAFEDVVSDDGRIHDERRVDYFRNHLAQAGRAIDAGVPLKGYFAWSLMDNFDGPMAIPGRLESFTSISRRRSAPSRIVATI